MTSPGSGPTSTSGFPGLLTPSFSRRRKRGSRASTRARLAQEERKVEARKKGQLRALTRL